jgi:hypothetical protein
VAARGGATIVRPRSLRPREALSLAAGALDKARTAVIVAPLEGPPEPCLGRWQRATSVTADPDPIRRRTGGVCLSMGSGQVYVAIAAPSWTTFFDATSRTVLSRWVRAVLPGLSALGSAARWSGRDWIAVSHRPVAWAGWEIAPSGATLLEALVAVSSPLLPPMETSRYPARREDPLRDAQPSTLWDVGVQRGTGDVADRLARGLTESLGVPCEEGRVPQGSFDAPPIDPRLVWGWPSEEPIGFVEAGIGIAEGTIVRARLAGDFYADSGGIAEVERGVQGLAPDALSIGKAVDSVYASDRHHVEGLASHRSIAGALLRAVERARGA